MRWSCEVFQISQETVLSFIFHFNSATHEAVKDYETRKKLTIIKSSNDKIFSHGGEIEEVASSSVERVKHLFMSGYRGSHLIANHKIPYIAMMSGLAVGRASMFSMSAKYRVSTEKTVFCSPETRIGFFNNSGSSYFLPRLNKNVGIYLGLTGVKLMGFDVKKVGLTTHHIEGSVRVRDLEETLINCEDQEDVERVLDEFSTQPHSLETKLDENVETIENCFGGLTVEQIIENLSADGSEFAMKTIKTLRKMSPTSLKVCHRLLNLGRHMSLKDCLRMEWRLCVHFATSSRDLQEGYRANFVDKDMKPQWNPKTIEEVKDFDIAKYFGPMLDDDELTFDTKRSSEGHFGE